MSTSTTHPSTATRRDPSPTRTAPRAGTPGEKAARRSAFGLGVVLVAQLMLVLDATVVNVALPHIQDRPRLHPGRPVLGAQRLHPRLRRSAAPRWPARRRPRAPAHLRARPRHLHRRQPARRSRDLARPGSSPPARSRASGPRSPHPASSPSSRRAPRTRPPATVASPCSRRCRRPAPPSACSSAACSPTSSAGTGPSSSTCRSASSCSCSPAGSSPRRPACADVRRRRGRHGDARLGGGRPRLHQRRRPRLDRAASRSARSPWVAAARGLRPHREPRRVDPCCPSVSSGSASVRGALVAHGARRRRAVLDLLPRHPVPPAGPRLQPDRDGRRVPPAQPRDLRDLAGQRAARREGRAAAPHAGRGRWG